LIAVAVRVFCGGLEEAPVSGGVNEVEVEGW